ncbi:hypothetical protein RND81_02G040900 [Saponaria officinalis]|uniref:PHD and RING finger domain-containing protein 1 n=1 Tax=Saponaria officinalis TaxID=3572 RepID=A0AAW1MPQ6_SAPOF
MENLISTTSPNKRQKTETLTLDSPISPSSYKGKAPITSNDDDDEIPVQLPSQNCGICLSDEGKTVRGFIDSCNHYFCFLCIIEWSKIDSRCPLCRARFSSIRRMRKDGSLIGHGSVPIPVRDQIYDAFGEPVDPYGQAKCSVCNGTKDESLLLLCDLCDSASHTYCVGLGATVPEDDWYCHDCDILRAEQSDSGICDAVETLAIPKKVGEVEDVHVDESETTAPVSIFDIVREPSEPRRTCLGTDRLLKLVSANPTKFSSSAIVSDHGSSKCSTNVAHNATARSMDCGPNARTLSKSRDVHRHLRVLRDNWDAFRTGSLSFPTKLSCPSGKVSQKIIDTTVSSKGSCKLQTTESLQSKPQKISCDVPQKERSYNVQRAWKLMKAAKSLHPADKAKGYSKNVSKHTHDLKVDNIVPKCVISNKKELTSPDLGLQKKPTKKVTGSVAQSLGKLQSTSFVPMAASASRSKHKNSCVPTSYTTTKVQTTVHPNISSNKSSVASRGEVGRGESSALFDNYTCSTSSIGPLLEPSDVSCSYSQKQKISTFSVKQDRKINIGVDSKDGAQSIAQTDFCYDGGNLPSLANLGPSLLKSAGDQYTASRTASLQETVPGGSIASTVKSKEKEISKYSRKTGDKRSKTSKDDEAKGEIVSLVKLNLKLLSKEKRIGKLVIFSYYYFFFCFCFCFFCCYLSSKSL